MRSQMLMLVYIVSRTWTRYRNARAGLQLVLVAWSRRIEREGEERTKDAEAKNGRRTQRRRTDEGRVTKTIMS